MTISFTVSRGVIKEEKWLVRIYSGYKSFYVLEYDDKGERVSKVFFEVGLTKVLDKVMDYMAKNKIDRGYLYCPDGTMLKIVRVYEKGRKV